ncbi:hypothetical protein LJB88_05000 [Erysipelotrichaceae bacterium OttesenSCG-928-M19]|nr:hypothetical protein [Erysipelotrichaceae bacterium OttesenSCG-928-M19]
MSEYVFYNKYKIEIEKHQLLYSNKRFKKVPKSLSDIDEVVIKEPTFFSKGILYIIFGDRQFVLYFKKDEIDKANKLKEEIFKQKDNSEAEKLAKAIEEAKNNPEDMEVVGTYFYDGLKILRNIVSDRGDVWNVGGYQNHKIELTLIPELDNEYDSNAIAVFSEHPTPPRARISRSGQIGHLPKGHGFKLDNPVKVKTTVKEGFGNFYIKISKKDVKRLRGD